jgi:glycosidase
MNYPLRDGILAFVRDGDAIALYDVLTELHSSYPRTVRKSLMNFLGTHDTERILTVLGDSTLGEGLTNAELSVAKLSPEARSGAIERLKTAFTLLFTVFGVPSVFYGDEAGLEGYRDPFCRRPFPWGREEQTLIDTVRRLGRLRAEHPALAMGDFTVVHHDAHSIAYERRWEGDRLLIAANRGDKPLTLSISGCWLPVDADISAKPSRILTVYPQQACIYKEVRA